MFLPIDYYLRQVTVMLANAQDDVSPGRPVEHRVELPKMMGDMFSDGRRNREVAACEFDLHPNAPFFHARSGGDRGGRLPDGIVCSTAFRRKGLVPKPFRLKAVLQTQFGLWLVELIDYQTAGLTRRSAPKRLPAAVRAIPEFSSGRGTWRRSGGKASGPPWRESWRSRRRSTGCARLRPRSSS